MDPNANQPVVPQDPNQPPVPQEPTQAQPQVPVQPQAPQQPTEPIPGQQFPQQPMPPQFTPRPLFAPDPIPPSAKKGHKLLIVVVVLVIILLATGGGALFALRNKPKNMEHMPQSQLITLPSSTDSATAQSKQTTTPTAADKLTTLCYSLTLPTPHDPLDGSNACNQSVNYGKDTLRSLNVDIPSVQYADFNQTIAQFQERHKADGIQSQKATTVGGLQAYEIVYKGLSTIYKSTIINVNNRGYKSSNVPLSSIEIWAAYQDDEYATKAQLDAVLTSVVWK